MAKTTIYVDTSDGPVPLLTKPFINVASQAAKDHKLFVQRAREALDEIFA